MNVGKWRPRVVAALTAGALASLTHACTGSDANRAGNADSPRGVAADSARVGADLVEVPVRGQQRGESRIAPTHLAPTEIHLDTNDIPKATIALTRPIEGMGFETLSAYVNRLVFSADPAHMSHEKLPCYNANAKRDCTKAERALVWIQPEWGFNKVDLKRLPKHGMIIGRLYNSGLHRTKRNFDSRKRVYWMIDSSPIPNEKALRSRFIELQPGAQGFKELEAHYFTPCDDHKFEDRPALARWRRCEDGPPTLESRRRVTSTGPGGPVAPDTSAWISCSHGCCVAGRAFSLPLDTSRRVDSSRISSLSERANAPNAARRQSTARRSRVPQVALLHFPRE